MTRLVRWSQWLCDAPRMPAVESLTRSLVYAWCIYATLAMVPAAGEFWGPHAPPGSGDLFDVLSRPGFAPLYPVVVAAFLAACVCGLFGRLPRTCAVVALVLQRVLVARAWAVFDGGDRLIGQLLFYLAVAQLAAAHTGPLANAIRNLCGLSMRVQLCVMYGAAGLSKWAGEHWPAGDGLYYVLQTDEYSLPAAQALFAGGSVVLALATYVVILFQLSFPFLVWRDPVRRPLLALGALIHLQIALVNGIASFGFALVVAYSVFYTDDEARRLRARIVNLGRRVADRGRQRASASHEQPRDVATGTPIAPRLDP